MPLIAFLALVGLKFSNNGISAFGTSFDHLPDDRHGAFSILVALFTAALGHGLGMPGFTSTLLEVIELCIHNQNVLPVLTKGKDYGISD
jgi:hypothetical protein